jgi:hypothetical protein
MVDMIDLVDVCSHAAGTEIAAAAGVRFRVTVHPAEGLG